MRKPCEIQIRFGVRKVFYFMQKGNVLLLMDFEIPVKRLKKRTIKLPYKSMFVNPLTILVANGTMYSGK